MPLFRDDEDFAASIGIAARRLGLHAQLVEKDYWVTEALRALVDEFGGEFTFEDSRPFRVWVILRPSVLPPIITDEKWPSFGSMLKRIATHAELL